MRHLAFITVLAWLFWCPALLAQPAVPASAPASAPAADRARRGGGHAAPPPGGRVPGPVLRHRRRGPRPAHRTHAGRTRRPRWPGPGDRAARPARQRVPDRRHLRDGAHRAGRRRGAPRNAAGRSPTAAERALAQAIAETRESRDRGHLLRAVAWSALATLAFVAAAWLIWRLRGAWPRRAPGCWKARTAGVRVAGHRSWRCRACAPPRTGRSGWCRAAAGAAQLRVAGVRAHAVPVHAGLGRTPRRASWSGWRRNWATASCGRSPTSSSRCSSSCSPSSSSTRSARSSTACSRAGPRSVGSTATPSAPPWRLVAVGIWLFAGVMAYPVPAGLGQRRVQGRVGARRHHDHAGRVEPDRAGRERADPDVLAHPAGGRVRAASATRRAR